MNEKLGTEIEKSPFNQASLDCGPWVPMERAMEMVVVKGAKIYQEYICNGMYPVRAIESEQADPSSEGTDSQALNSHSQAPETGSENNRGRKRSAWIQVGQPGEPYCHQRSRQRVNRGPGRHASEES